MRRKAFALERAGRWGRRRWTLVAAGLTALLIFSLLDTFLNVAFRAVAGGGGG